MADLTEDEVAQVLSGMIPRDREGKEEHWDAANKFAAAELIRAMPTLRERAANSLALKVSRRATQASELGYLMAKEGRRFRNDYLAKVG